MDPVNPVCHVVAKHSVSPQSFQQPNPSTDMKSTLPKVKANVFMPLDQISPSLPMARINEVPLEVIGKEIITS